MDGTASEMPCVWSFQIMSKDVLDVLWDQGPFQRAFEEFCLVKDPLKSVRYFYGSLYIVVGNLDKWVGIGLDVY